MTAQEWFDELERLSEAATPGPWDVNQKNLTVYDNYGDSVCDTQQTHNAQNNLAYIVAACNAVPRLVEMLVFLASLPSEDDKSVDAIERRIQWAYNETRPKE